MSGVAYCVESGWREVILTTPKLAMVLGFVAALGSIMVLYQRGSAAGGAGVEADTIYWVLFYTMLLGALVFYVALGMLARRLGKNPIVWVGLTVITTPIGPLVALPWMLILAGRERNEATT